MNFFTHIFDGFWLDFKLYIIYCAFSRHHFMEGCFMFQREGLFFRWGGASIDIGSRSKVDIRNHIFVFQCCNWREVEIKECSFSFTNKFLFLFLSLVMCLMSKFKKTEYNLICKVFTEVFLITRIPHSTVLITEVDVQRCSVWKVFLKILQNSLGNTCTRVSFLIKLAGLVKFLRTSFLTEHLQWMLL